MALIVGDGNNNTETGTDDADTIRLLGGDDTGFGGQGDDRIEGGSGKDELFGEEGDDTLLGQTGNDTLSGGDGKDRLNGGSGVDTLVGGEGDDTLRGEGNADDFVFNVGDGEDTVQDFTLNSDDIVLAGFDQIGIEDFTQLEFEQSGTDALVLFGEDQAIRLRNIDKDDLTAGDFVFDEAAFQLFQIIEQPPFDINF